MSGVVGGRRSSSTSGSSPGIVAALRVRRRRSGVLNGLLIAKVGINPFVATLGMQVLIYGPALSWPPTHARCTACPPSSPGSAWARSGPCRWRSSSTGVVLATPGSSCAARRFGQHIYAVGGGTEAERLAGINVDRVTDRRPTASAGSARPSAAWCCWARRTSASRATAETWPLTAIAAVVVGGVPLSGRCRAVWARRSWAPCCWASSPTP